MEDHNENSSNSIEKNLSGSEDAGLELEQEDAKPNMKGWYAAQQGGRPSSKGESAKRWRDEETLELIRLWQENEILYNNKHAMYYSKEEREKTVRDIQGILADKNIHATFEQIWDKLTNLKCYYGSQKREIEHKRSREFKDYESPWKFYSYLGFLDDHLIARKKRDAYVNSHEYKTKGPKRPKFIDECSLYDIKNASPSMVQVYTSPEQPQPNGPGYWHDQPPSMATAITSTTSNVTTTTTSPSDLSKSEDATFCELMCKMLNQIPESEEKALLKIELQQRVIACRYKS